MNRVQTTDAFWRSASVLVSELSFKWHSFMFLTLFCSKSAHFSEIQLVCDGRTDRRTDGRTDRRTDGRTDTPSYRDARTHLKSISILKYNSIVWISSKFQARSLTLPLNSQLFSLLYLKRRRRKKTFVSLSLSLFHYLRERVFVTTFSL